MSQASQDLLFQNQEPQPDQASAPTAQGSPESGKPKAKIRMDEQSKRRPDFSRSGNSIVSLASMRQPWYFPKPRVRFTPDDSDGFRTILDLDDDYQALVDAYNAAFTENEQGVGNVVQSEIALGKRLLLRNYTLTNAEIGTILQFGYDQAIDPEASDIRNAVIDVALGIAPKAGGGS